MNTHFIGICLTAKLVNTEEQIIKVQVIKNLLYNLYKRLLLQLKLYLLTLLRLKTAYLNNKNGRHRPNLSLVITFIMIKLPKSSLSSDIGSKASQPDCIMSFSKSKTRPQTELGLM